MRTKEILLRIICSLILLSLGWWGSDNYKKFLNQDTDLPAWNKPRPLEKYTIENLSKTNFASSKINIDGNLFNFTFDPTLSGKNEKKVTGLINYPDGNESFPIVVLLRGYVDQSIYTTGTGTKRVGEYFSENGYITLAPDFLGYGGSDIESSNIFEARFQTYTTVLTLLKSINKENFPQWDNKNIFIWGHSNGGQIALTVLEITGEKYPTVLWAPVTENFPYSVLFYTNESDDRGKFIRKELSKFESEYDVDKFSLTNYLDKINAPVEYHYGTNDDAIPTEWRDRFVKQMKALNKDFTNYNHPGADHNMNPLWGDVMSNTRKFFENQKI
jgi:dipeptidyl aminopeptidase/acylaminoacyl peptidase